MELSNSLDSMTLYDIKWAVENHYETDIKWVALNVISLLSQPQPYKKIHKKHFKEIVGRTYYTSHTSPSCNWSGWWQDAIDVIAAITNQSSSCVEYELKCFTHPHNEDNLLSIRLRYFGYTNKKPVFAESAKLQKDDDSKPYMWVYIHNMLTPVPEQYLKEQLILWDNKDILCS